MSLIKKLAGLMFVVGFSGFAGPLLAATTCSGKVDALGLDNNSGTVMVVLGGLDHTRLCSVSKDFGKISPDSCRAIYAKLLASKAAGTEVTLYFFGATASCSDRSVFPAWDESIRDFYYTE